MPKPHIDLGLAIFSCYALPGVCYTLDEIAAWCGCSRQAIENIQRKALIKLRNYLRDRQDGELWREVFEEHFHARKPATKQRNRTT